MISIYKGPLNIINNCNNTYVSNSGNYEKSKKTQKKQSLQSKKHEIILYKLLYL